MPLDTSPTWSTARLLYRAVEPVKDVDFFLKMNADPQTSFALNGTACLPMTVASAEKLVQYSEKALVSVIICLVDPEVTSPHGLPQAGPAIGWMSLGGISPSHAHHRNTHFGIGLLTEFQGKGYGTEAMGWLLKTAFRTCNLNKVEGNVFSWNTGARALYKKIGFVEEGIKRQSLFPEGAFRDEVLIGILAEEWRALNE